MSRPNDEMAPDLLKLMECHVHTLFTHDDRGHLAQVNDWRGGAAPRLYLGKTLAGIVFRTRGDLNDSLREHLAECVAAETPDLTRPVNVSRYCELLNVDRGKASFGPTYCFTDASDYDGEATLLSQDNAGVLAGELDDWLPDVPHQQPFAAAIDAARAVSVCASVRITPDAHEAGVETLAAYRRQGFARSAVATWARAVRESGALPMYSTSVENIASRRLAERLGLLQYGVEFSIP